MNVVRVTASVVVFAAAVASSAAAAVPPVPPTFLQSLNVNRPGLVFAVGDSVILRSRDNGRSWQTFRVPGVPNIAGAAFVDANRWFVAGASTRGTTVVPVWRTADSGVTWRHTVLPRQYPDGHGAVAFHFVDSRHGSLTVDTVHSGAFANDDLYVTGDGGESWHYRATEPFTGPVMITGSRGWAVGGVGSEKLFSTTDNGRHWAAVTLPIPAALRGGTPTIGLPQALGQTRSGGVELALPTWYATPGSGKTRNSVVVYTSSDDGRHWKATTTVYDPGFGNYGPGTLIPASFTSPTQWSIGASVRLYVTTDAGRSWRSLKTDSRTSGLYGLIGAVQLAFPTSNVGFALIQYGHCREFKRSCTERSFVMRSTSGGKTWTLLSLDGDPSAFPRCRASQLSANAAFGAATGSELGGVTLRNTSRLTCSLPTRPLDLRLFLKGYPFTARDTVIASFPQVPRTILRPGAAAYTAIQWSNWCGPRPSAGALMSIVLDIGDSQPVIADMSEPGPPRCEAPKTPSLLWIGAFVEPPR